MKREQPAGRGRGTAPAPAGQVVLLPDRIILYLVEIVSVKRQSGSRSQTVSVCKGSFWCSGLSVSTLSIAAPAVCSRESSVAPDVLS